MIFQQLCCFVFIRSPIFMMSNISIAWWIAIWWKKQKKKMKNTLKAPMNYVKSLSCHCCSATWAVTLIDNRLVSFQSSDNGSNRPSDEQQTTTNYTMRTQQQWHNGCSLMIYIHATKAWHMREWHTHTRIPNCTAHTCRCHKKRKRALHYNIIICILSHIPLFIGAGMCSSTKTLFFFLYACFLHYITHSITVQWQRSTHIYH